MFNSKKVNYSHNLDNITLPTVNDGCNGIPKMTSTPLNPRHVQLSRRSSVLLSPTKSKLITPRRYSLSEINSPSNKSNLRIQEACSPGPLLASLSFKDNVSMYEETKSSGLARRIVLYNEEAEQERHPTHQEKYDSPGLFPIVHLFKKKPPFLQQSPKRVKIKLSSPDYLKSHSPQHRSKLLEGLARPRLHNQHSLSSCSQNSNDTGTKSVLDALKEISRKRIHSNEECDFNGDSGKRIRTELHNGATTTSKRNRADSPQLDSSESPPPKQTQKKFCVYDEFAASKSSTDFSFLKKMEPSRSKRKTISTSTESLKEIKHVKLINAETQTIISSSESKTKPAESNNDVNDSQNTKKKGSPLKVFDDAPLDRIRKNRLAALMGNLAGKGAAILPKSTTVDKLTSETSQLKGLELIEPKPIEKPNESETIFAPPPILTKKENKNEADLASKPLISILSPPKTTKELSPVRSDKHVHFNLPGRTSPSALLTRTSASVVTPIVSASISHSSLSNNTEKNTGVSLGAGSVDLKAKSPSTSSPSPSFSFDNQGSTKSDTQISTAIDTSGSSTNPLFSFSKPLQSSKQDMFNVPKLTFEAPKTSSPQKSGGFKFELKTPTTIDVVSSSTSKSETPTLSFSKSSIASSITTTSLSNASTFVFGKPNEPKKDSPFNFGAASPANSSIPSEPTFGFGGGLSKSQTFSNVTTESKLSSLNSTTTTSFSFGSTGNAPALGMIDSSAKFTALGTTTTTTTTTTRTTTGSSTFTSLPTFGFTQSAVATTNSAMFAFGGSTATTAASGFGSKLTYSFGTNSTPATSSSMFENSGATTVSGFGNIPTTTSAFGSIPSTSTPGFGTTPVSSFGNTSVTSAPIFGNAPSTSISVFGTTPVTSTPIFGSTPVPTSGFGSAPVTSTSVFGSTNTSTSGFGIAVSTTPSVFGNNSSTFGSNSTTTAPMFGSSKAKTAAFGSSSVFGTANTHGPTFGSNTASGFGNSSQPKPMFGASSIAMQNAPLTFGSSTFGGITTAASTTTSAPIVGVNNPNPIFSFGSNKPATNVFGSITTTSSNTFGSSTFSSTSGFDTSAGFGNSTPGFGAASTPAFGQVENKSAFAFGGTNENKPNPVFGSGAGNSAFGKPINTQSGFGSSTGGFGSTGTSGFSSQQTNGGFNFGSNAVSSSPAPFAFGANSGSTELPKPTFNFTGGTTNPPAFGSNNSTPAFGSSNPSFGAPTFGAMGSPATGVFNIGAGSNTGRPRTQLRAKRRT